MIINGYYHPVEIMESLSHIKTDSEEIYGDCNLAVCIGNRTGGKTVGFALEYLRAFMDFNERSIILCRTKEIQKKKYLEKWWNKTLSIDDDIGIVKRFKSIGTISFTEDAGFVNGEQFTYCIPISASSEVKDTGQFFNTTTISLDEAIQPFESSLIINGKPAFNRIWEIWQTAARGWPMAIERCRIILISNSTEVDNWVFNDLGINKWFRKGAKLSKNNGIIVEKVMNDQAKEKLMESVMGRIMASSKSGKIYLESAAENKFSDNSTFVKKKPMDFSKLMLQIKTEGIYLGLFDTEESIHIEQIRRDKRSSIVCNNPREQEEDVIFSASGKEELMIRQMFENGVLTFGSQRAKNAALRYAGVLKKY